MDALDFERALDGGPPRAGARALAHRGGGARSSSSRRRLLAAPPPALPRGPTTRPVADRVDRCRADARRRRRSGARCRRRCSTELRARGGVRLPRARDVRRAAGHPGGRALARAATCWRRRAPTARSACGTCSRARASPRCAPSCTAAPATTRARCALAFSPDGALLASGHVDGSIHLWDVARGEEVQVRLRHEQEMVSALAFSPDGRTLATGGVDVDAEAVGRGARRCAGEARRELVRQPAGGDGARVRGRAAACWSPATRTACCA